MLEPSTRCEVLGIDFRRQFPCKFVELTFAIASRQLWGEFRWRHWRRGSGRSGRGLYFGHVQLALTVLSVALTVLHVALTVLHVPVTGLHVPLTL